VPKSSTHIILTEFLTNYVVINKLGHWFS